MKKQVLLLLFLLLAQLAGICQENKISISGSFTDEPFLAFAKAIESTYDLKFFFDDADVKNLKVNGQFNQTPLANCLNQIIEGTGLLFAIKNSQVFIYSGKKLQPLFLEQETELGKPAEKTEEQLSRERLLAKQYELINIGLPGSQNTGYATVSGRISVYNDTLSVPGCNVYTEDESYGTSSDSEGDYSLRLPLGQHTLIFSSVGMESTQRQIHLYANGRLDVEMESKVNLIGDVQIMGDQKGNLNRVDVGMERIDVRSVKNLPKLLGEPDIMKSTLILPGVATVGEGASGFNVRGGKTDQNLILIDQTPIYYPSHFFGNFSAINSDVVKDANLYKGSFPVKYGGRISSVFQINTKDADAEKIQGAGGISPVSAKFMVEGPIKKDRSSFLLSFRSTYSDWILKQVAVDELYKSAVNFYDLQGKFSFSLNKNNKLIFNLYGSEDGFQLRSDTTYNYYNNLVSSSLNTRFENNWKMQNVLSLSAFGYNIANKKDSLRAFELIHSLQNYSYKNLTEKTISENVKVIMGGEMQLYFVEPGERKIPPNSELTPVFTQTERGLEYGLFAGTEFSPVNGLKLETGIRLAGYLSLADGQKNSYREGLPLTEENLIETVETEINSIEKQYIYPEFRLSSNYRLSSYTALKFSYNTTTQFLHMLTNTTAISPTDTWKLSDEFLAPQRGHLLSAGIVKSNYQRTLEMSVEGFYKRMNNVKEYKPGADLLLNDHIETEILNGTGKSYGAEFSLQKNGERLYGRLGYTYSRTLIKTETEFEEELINDGEYFPANYDKPHNLNILANLEPARGIVLSVLMNYSTGRPITYPVTKYQLGDQVILHYSDYNQFRIPDYFRIDASLTIDRNLKKNKLIDGSWSFSVYNITARKNAYSVYYRSQGDHFEGFRLSIFGTAIPTVTYNFKF